MLHQYELKILFKFRCVCPRYRARAIGRSRPTWNPDTFTYDKGHKGTLADSFWGHRLNIDLTFQATDEISVYWSMRGPDFRRFGSGNDTRSGIGLETRHVYGRIDQNWGVIRIGRLDEDLDSYGLGSLGYAPSTDPMWTFVSPFDEGSQVDGLRFTREWDNGFALLAQYGKVNNNGGGDSVTGAAGQGWPDNNHSDQDWDRFQLEGTYKWDGGGLALGLRYDRNATLFRGEYYGDPDFPWLDVWGQSWQFDKKSAFYLNPAFMHSWGAFSLHFEGMAGWAKTKVAHQDNGIPNIMGPQQDLDEEGYAFFLDADYNYGPGNVTLAGWWASGTELGKGYGPRTDPGWDPTRYGKSKSLVSIDQGNFYPLIIAFNGSSSGWGRESDGAVAVANNGYQFVDEALYGRGLFLNDDMNAPLWAGQYNAFRGFVQGESSSGRERLKSFNNDSGAANHWAVNLSGNHAFSDDISLHYAWPI